MEFPLRVSKVFRIRFAGALAVALGVSGVAMAGPGEVLSQQRFTNGTGGLSIDPLDAFGRSALNVGDRDGNGVNDLIVGAPGDDDGGSNRGALYVLFLNADGSLLGHQKLSNTTGGFTAPLGDEDQCGYGLGLRNGVVFAGTPKDDDGGQDRGAIWILQIAPNGTTAAPFLKISDTEGGFTGTMANQENFGSAIANLGDLDGNGSDDLAVGAFVALDSGFFRGAVWILFFNGGAVSGFQKISASQGNFAGTINSNDQFGHGVANVGDIDGDGVTDLAVGARLADDGGMDRGAVFILFLKTDGTVKSHQRISDTAGGFAGTLANEDRFGTAVAGVGDLNEDGVNDVAVGAPGSGGGGLDPVPAAERNRQGLPQDRRRRKRNHHPSGTVLHR